MHHYSFNIGDYRKDTGHLTLLEHGVYRMLLDSYYENEGPLKADDARLMRTHCIRTAEEEQAYKNVITDFFQEENGYYRHEGCDKVLEKIYAKSEKARAAAQERWNRKNSHLNGNKTGRNADAMRTHTEGNAGGMPPITHNPVPKDTCAGAHDPPSKSKKKSLITIDRYIADCEARGVKPIPPDSPPIQEAERCGIPLPMVHLAWCEFRQRNSEAGKKYKNWPLAFKNCISSNWYKLWWLDGDQYALTTQGKQAQIKHGVDI